jgi:hypothetical protein
LEYLTRTHPLRAGDAWGVHLIATGAVATISFAQAAGRGFEVQHHSLVGQNSGWQMLTNLPASTTNGTAAVGDSMDHSTNRFYRVRVFEP